MHRRTSPLLLLPGMLFLSVMFLLPFLLFSVMAFRKDVGLGKVGPFSLDNFVTIFTDPFYLSVLSTTLRLSFWVTLFSVLIGYPLAYLLVRLGPRWSGVVLPVLLVSSFVSVVIRALGWVIVLGRNGIINRFLQFLGLPEPVAFMNNETGVVVGMVHFLLPMAVLTLMSVLRTIPYSLEEAAASLGAPRWRVFLRVVVPLSLPGVISLALLIFSVTCGIFTTTILLGGAQVLTLPVLIYQEMMSKARYGMGSALSLVQMVLVLAINLLMYGVARLVPSGVRQA